MLPIVTLNSCHLKLVLSATWQSYCISFSHFMDGCFIPFFLTVTTLTSLLSLSSVNYVFYLSEKTEAEYFFEPLPLCHSIYQHLCPYTLLSRLLLWMKCPSSPILPFVDQIPFLVIHHFRILLLFLLHHHSLPSIFGHLPQHILFF